MPAENPIVLLLEDCPVTGLLIERAILHALPTCRLVWARGIEDATRRIASIPVELFLVDIGLPDGSGLDFLVAMSEAHPSARAIVMTASPLPEYQMNSAALGVLNFLQKPVNMTALLDQMRTALDTEQMDCADEDFSATLKNVTPVDILQLKCLSGDTTVIEFRSGTQAGFVHFQNGEIVHAQIGTLKGPTAINEIISWKRGKVVEHANSRTVEKSIHCSWQTLLMNAAQRLDEGALVVG
jgi:DNA-binding response OmpR family regulator